MTKMFTKNLSLYLLLGTILLLHVFILSRLIFFPYPELFINPYLTNHGLKPYSQILDQHFPGLMFLPINLDNLGMNTPEEARIWSIAIVILTQALLFFISSSIFKSKRQALFVNLLYLIWQPFFEGWILWIDSFLPLLLLPAFYLFWRSKLFFAGLLLGLGVIFKQVLIPLMGLLALYAFWQKRNFKGALTFVLGSAVPVTLMLIYFISTGIFKDFWFWTVEFNLTTYAQTGRGIRPTSAHLIRVIFVFGLSVLALALNRFKTKEAQLLGVFLTGTLLGLATRFDFVHFQPALPFAVLATVYGFSRLGRFKQLGIASLYIAVSVWWLVIFYKGHLGNRVITFDADTKTIAAKIKDYTERGEKIFIFGTQPHLYQMSETVPAGDIFTMQVPWFLKFAEERMLEGLKKDQPRIILVDKVNKFEGANISEFAPRLNEYIEQNYTEFDSVGDVRILRKKSS